MAPRPAGVAAGARREVIHARGGRSAAAVRFRRQGCDGARDHAAMYRAPKPADLFHAPPEFLCATGGVSMVALPIGGRIDPRMLRTFVRAMAAQGHAVQSARLGYDRRYALDCLALAHASSDAALRSLALQLFAAYERTQS
jgi:hypothetical protein